MGGGEGQFSASNRQLTSTVKAKPAKPEQASTQNDLGDVVGRSARLRPTLTASHQSSQDEGRHARTDVHHSATGEVQIFAKETPSPNHVGQRGIHHKQPERGE